MKTLYEILEVSENASKEIIEKAYKVLAKKYHPDLQPEGEKEKAEQSMKQINEAYDILSDDNKREKYDEQLKLERQKIEEQKNAQSRMQNNNYQDTNYHNMSNRNNAQNNYDTTNNYQKNEYSNNKNENINEQYYKNMQERMRKRQEEIKMQQEQERNVREQYERRYQQAYEDYLRSLGYKIKYKWTWKNYRDLLIIIGVIIVVCIILWFFPPTHKIIMDFYNSNPIIANIINIIGRIIVGIWNGICSFFSKK